MLIVRSVTRDKDQGGTRFEEQIVSRVFNLLFACPRCTYAINNACIGMYCKLDIYCRHS